MGNQEQGGAAGNGRPPDSDTRDTLCDAAATAGRMGLESLGPYRIISEIGRGGMGVVYKAYHPELKRTVALKVLIAGEDASDGAIARFRREAEAVARLGHHPNIVPVYDIGCEGRLHYFAMHFVDGKSLDKRIREGMLESKSAALITRKIAEALQHAHANGVLHRDIKPANILMADSRQGSRVEGGGPGRSEPRVRSSEEGGAASCDGQHCADAHVLDPRPSTLHPDKPVQQEEPMLTDFGLAKDAASESNITRSGVTLGTLHYMPPEQADGRIRDIDARSDIYSLGATLYEMLAGKPPLDAETDVNLIHRILFDEPLPVRSLNPAADRDIETICHKCLSKDSAMRYQSALELSEDLGRYLRGEAVKARPASIVQRVYRKARRQKAIIATVMVASMLLAGGGLAALLVIGRSREETEQQTEIAGREKERAERNEMLRVKGQQSYRVLIKAVSRLGSAQEDLMRTYRDWKKKLPDRQAAYAKHEADVEEFCMGVSSDPPSQSAMLAVKGWLLRLGGRDREARDAFRMSQEADPDLPWGFLFAAMARLSDYLSGHDLPCASIIEGVGVDFGNVPAERPAVRAAREEFGRLIESALKAGAWGGGGGGEIKAAFAGLSGMSRGDWAAAESGLTAAMEIPELSWMREDLLFGRAVARHWRKDFDGAVADAEAYLRRCGSDWRISDRLGMSLHSKGIMISSRRGDPVPWYERAIKAFSDAIEGNPEDPSMRGNRGVAYMSLGEALESRGQDPSPAHQKAMEDIDESLRINPKDHLGLNNRGTIRIRIAETFARTGLNPINDLRAAVSDFMQSAALNPGYTAAYNNCGTAFLRIGDEEADQGMDPVESYRKALGCFEAVIRLEAGNASALNNSGNARVKLADVEKAAGKDPIPELRKAVEDYGKVLSSNPAHQTALGNRAMALVFLAKAEAAAGLDPRPNFARAVDDCAAAVRLNPGNAAAHANLGNVHLTCAMVEAGRAGDPREALKKAIEAFGTSLDLNPSNAGAWNNRGLAYMKLAQAEAAAGEDPGPSYLKSVENCEKAASLNPSFWQALSNAATAYEMLGRCAEAAKAYERALAAAGREVPSLMKSLNRMKVLAAMPSWAGVLNAAEWEIEEGNYTAAGTLIEKALKEAKESGAYSEERFRPFLLSGHYNSACITSQASAGKAGPKAAPKPLPPGKADALQRIALENLRMAFELGWDDFQHVREDTDLDPIRRAPEFADLLKEWEAKKK